MKRRKGLSTAYLTVILLLMYLPVLMVILYSFNDSKNTGMWVGFTTQWYGKLFRNQGLKDALINSLILAAWSVSLSGIIGTMGAIGLTRRHFRGAQVLETVSTLPMMIPEIVLGMAYLVIFSAAGSAIGFSLGMPTLVIAHTTFCVPYVLINVKGRLLNMDPALEEAGRDLGAGPLRVFFDITLPLISPAVISGMLLALAMSMDDVIISSYVTGATATTLPVKIYSGLKTGVSPEINALCTIMLGVIFLAIALSQLVGAAARKRQEKRSME